jgi:tRNA(adenine34) deaminase
MNEKYMMIALEEAEKAYKKGEIPVGCVIVENDKILAKTHNLKEQKKSALCHAELLAIYKASKKKKNWRLTDCDIYITMEPCPMCASAIKQSRIKRIFYGTENKNNKISKKILNSNDINEKVEVVEKIMEYECKKIVQKFFENQRKN